MRHSGCRIPLGITPRTRLILSHPPAIKGLLPSDPDRLTNLGGPHETFAARERGRILRQALRALTSEERQAIETVVAPEDQEKVFEGFR